MIELVLPRYHRQMNCNVKVLHFVEAAHKPGEWYLCFQWCEYRYTDGTKQNGYRFIWRKPDGKLQGARGQARLPSIAEAEALMDAAKAAGWGGLSG